MQEIFDSVGFAWFENVSVLLVGLVAVFVLVMAYRNVKKVFLFGGSGSSLTKEEKEYLNNYDPRDADYNK